MTLNDHDVYRVSDARAVNAIVADPSVDPWVRGPVKGRIDLTEITADPRNFCLVGRHGCAIFRPLVDLDHFYEWHAAVLPSGKGRWALGAARAALTYLFRYTTAVAVIAPVPQPNRAARQIVGALGFELLHVAPGAWPIGRKHVSLHFYWTKRSDWSAPCQ
jgi:hypothetical protein